ncbi:MAG: hypothetical protein KDJ41_12290 [Hyphomicrobiaceae bacterium]|nr:hypothetical protein [Hyphomicrobiaceae bacterium]
MSTHVLALVRHVLTSPGSKAGTAAGKAPRLARTVLEAGCAFLLIDIVARVSGMAGQAYLLSGALVALTAWLTLGLAAEARASALRRASVALPAQAIEASIA